MYCVKSCEKMSDPDWLGYKFQSKCYSTEERFPKLCDMCHNRKVNINNLFSTFTYETSSKSKNIDFDVNQIIYPVKEKFEVCGYNPRCFVSLGCIIDYIIMELLMNLSHKEK